MDILLTENGDIRLENTDISLTQSIRQAIKIRLQWFFAEWRFERSWGVPYFENVVIKNPNLQQIKQIIRKEISAVDGVQSVNQVEISHERAARQAKITFSVTIHGEKFQDEIIVFELLNR